MAEAPTQAAEVVDSVVGTRERFVRAWERTGLIDAVWAIVGALVAAGLTLATAQDSPNRVLWALGIATTASIIVLAAQFTLRLVAARGDILSQRLDAVIDQRNELRSVVEKVSEKRKVAYDLLNKLCYEAQALTQRRVTSEEEWKQWRSDYGRYLLVFGTVLPPVLKPHDWHRVSYVELHYDRPYKDEFNLEHRVCWQALNTRILAIREVMKDYAD